MKLRNNSEFTEKNNNKTHKGTVVMPAFPSTIVRLDKDSDFDFVHTLRMLFCQLYDKD